MKPLEISDNHLRVMNLEDWLQSVLDAREGLDVDRLRAACELASQAEQKALATVGPGPKEEAAILLG